MNSVEEKKKIDKKVESKVKGTDFLVLQHVYEQLNDRHNALRFISLDIFTDVPFQT